MQKDTIKKFINKYPPGTLILIFFFVASLLFIGLAFLDLDTARNLVREDAVIENMQAVLFLAGTFLWGCAFFLSLKVKEIKRRQRIFYILFLGLFLFLFMEEISWGQRMFGFSTPESLEDVNMQGETNIHNIGSESTMMWMNVLQALLFAILGIIIPLLNLTSKRISTILDRIKFPIVPNDLVICFGIPLCFYYEPGLHWSVPFRMVCLLTPIIMVISGKFKWLFSNFKYPKFQIFTLAVIGFLLIALNVNLETASHLKNNVAWEFRELLIALVLLFFAAFKVHEIWKKKKIATVEQIESK